MRRHVLRGCQGEAIGSGQQTSYYIYMYMYQYNVTIALQAGVVDEMNEFASCFMSENEKREEIISEASAAADTHKDPK